MAGSTCESGVGRSLEGALSGEALAEWRSSEQVENGIASTSPPYWDTDDDEDCGPKPSDLYGKYTWKIDKFSQINKRELRSNAFEVGNYKWYILIYPQGCDVCNHLSLFLCVANHDKLLPGWSHFAQFTIAVMNKDPRKSKYSDTLHRFWKKEHDWGWKKFMELSKVMDGFVNADSLIIKAQVQVIRERPDRPFPCLDTHYRRELVRVYLTNVEQICRRFVDEKKNKLVNLIEDKARWSSFRCFWMAIHPSSRQYMCREKRDDILRIIVKQTFIEKEVTSTLVMDSLYSGLRALEDESKGKIGSSKILNIEELAAPIVHVENGMFVLVDDFLKLLERTAIEPFPPKDDKGSQNRIKDGGLEDCSTNSIARYERRLTELGRKTIEIFALTNIFSKIEDAYKELVALKRQEELIREEEALLAETEQKAKHGASEKEIKSKKKQAKQKRKNRKGKGKGKTEKPIVAVEDDLQSRSFSDDEGLISSVSECNTNKQDDVADVSESVSCLPEIPCPGSEEKDVSWDTEVLETHTSTDASSTSVSVQRVNMENNNPSLVDDASSSTCSTDSVPSVIVNDPNSGYSLPKQRNRRSTIRMKNQREDATTYGAGNYDVVHSRQAISGASKVIGAGRSGKAESQSKASTLSFKGKKTEEHHMAKKESNMKGQTMEEKAFKETVSSSTPSKTISSNIPTKPALKNSGPTNLVPIKNLSSNFSPQADRATSVVNTADSTNVEAQKVVLEKPPHPLSRPLSAPIVPAPNSPIPIVSHVQTSLTLSRSVSYAPLSYKNAIMGITQSQSQSQSPSSSHLPSSSLSTSSISHTQVYHNSSSSSTHPSQSHTQREKINSPERNYPELSKPSISFGVMNQNLSRNGPLSREIPQRENINCPGLVNTLQTTSQEQLIHCGLGDDFPHLDIINNLLDDEQGLMMDNLHNLSNEDLYDNGYELGYGPFAGNFDLLEFGDLIPQINSGMYVNEHIDGLIPNQWPMNTADLAYYNSMNVEANSYPYNFLEYGYLACNLMGYNAFGPYNAH